MIRTFYDPGLVEKGREEGSRLILQKQINKRSVWYPGILKKGSTLWSSLSLKSWPKRSWK